MTKIRLIDANALKEEIDNDFKLCYISRRVVEWCSIKYETVPFKRLVQEHYWELAMKGGAE